VMFALTRSQLGEAMRREILFGLALDPSLAGLADVPTASVSKEEPERRKLAQNRPSSFLVTCTLCR
jgi:hypothetical protein